MYQISCGAMISGCCRINSGRIYWKDMNSSGPLRATWSGAPGAARVSVPRSLFWPASVRTASAWLCHLEMLVKKGFLFEILQAPSEVDLFWPNSEKKNNSKVSCSCRMSSDLIVHVQKKAWFQAIHSVVYSWTCVDIPSCQAHVTLVVFHRHPKLRPNIVAIDIHNLDFLGCSHCGRDVPGWWWLEHVLFFQKYWEFHHPNSLSFCSEGLKPTTRYFWNQIMT